jgi:hypothetical protein
LDLLDYRYEDGIIRASIQGAGTSRLKLIASRPPVVIISGNSIKVHYDPATGRATVELELSLGQVEELEIQ